jgi:transcriptional/translational regulatory protein YebC/TACO1
LKSKSPYDEEKVIEAAIEAGVDDVDFYSEPSENESTEEDEHSSPPKLILTSPESLGALQDALTSASINMEVSERCRIQY